MTDIAIIGGGGMGSAVAYFLKCLGPPDLSVTVFERDATYCHASTALAAGGIRQQFTTPENIRMSQYGYEFLMGASEELAVGADAPEMNIRQIPYLLLGGAADLVVLRESYDLQTRLGSGADWLEPEVLAARFPWMNVDGVAGSVLGGPREGIFDPYGLLQALRRKAIGLGATFVETEVTGFELGEGGRCEAVRLADGGSRPCGHVVNAAGPAAGHVALLAGLHLPVIPLKGQTFAFHTRSGPVDCPIILDRIQGLNVRPEGGGFIVGVTLKTTPPDVAVDYEVDYDLFDSIAWPALAHRVSGFDAIKMTGAWAGHIEWNAFDANPVIGPHPECKNFYFANGFSGHGAQHIPAAGRAVAELVLFGEFRTLDLSRLGYQRIVENRPLTERC